MLSPDYARVWCSRMALGRKVLALKQTNTNTKFLIPKKRHLRSTRTELQSLNPLIVFDTDHRNHNEWPEYVVLAHRAVKCNTPDSIEPGDLWDQRGSSSTVAQVNSTGAFIRAKLITSNKQLLGWKRKLNNLSFRIETLDCKTPDLKTAIAILVPVWTSMNIECHQWDVDLPKDLYS